MQIQLDPNIPTALTLEEMRDFKTFLDIALETLTDAAGGQIFTTGSLMLTGLALIVVVLNGVKIAFSGNIQPWELGRVIIGIWIPWVMLQFYTTPIPDTVPPMTFPGIIAAGGNWLHSLLLDDSVSSMQTELGNLVRSIGANITTTPESADIWSLMTRSFQATLTAIAGTVMSILMVLMLLILFAITYAQVIWAHIALAILTILGPIFIPFLVFEPMAFLFWGWFRAMITYSLYGVIAGAVLRVFSAVAISFITSMGNSDLDTQSFVDVSVWVLAVVPMFVAGLLASLKCGELASMLVTSAGAGGSGLMGMATTGAVVASGGAAAAAKAGAGGVK